MSRQEKKTPVKSAQGKEQEKVFREGHLGRTVHAKRSSVKCGAPPSKESQKGW